MPVASWLFVRGSESIWVERPSGNTLIVAGPGHRRYQRTFFTEDQLQEFQIQLAEQLVEQRWFLWAYNDDRRKARRDDAAIPPGGDRRLSRSKRSATRAGVVAD